MKIHREGIGILIALFAILIIANGILFLTTIPRGIILGTSVISAVLFLFVLSFFRCPPRHFDEDPTNLIIAPADGTVVVIEEVFEPEIFKDKRIQISIFMSLFNIHANWYPVAGKVLKTLHHNGRFMAAYLPKSSTENERSTVVIETPDGQQILTRQIAGAMARRIVTYAKEDDKVSLGEQMGFIKFGSRVDVFLPLDAKILVKPNQKSVATQTVLARLKPSKK